MIRTGQAFWTLLSLGALGCAPLEDLPRGVCGNAIVEQSVGEDCDSFVEGGFACGSFDDSVARACHYLCDLDAGCPPGYGCGFDGVCRRPDLVAGYTFGSGASFSEELSGRVQLGDVDGDGVMDLVGFSKTSVIARFGAGDGSFAAEAREILSLGVPISINVEPKVGDINGDGTADVVAPHTQGVQVLAGIPGGRGFTPVPFPQIVLDHAEPGDSRIVGVQAGQDQFQVFVAVLPLSGEPCVVLIDPARSNPVACEASKRLSGELTAALPRRTLVTDLDEDGASEVLLSFAGSSVIYVFSVRPPGVGGDPSSLLRLSDITLGGELRSTGRLFIGDINADGLRDLIVEATRPNGSHVVAVARGMIPPQGTVGADDRLEDVARIDQRRSRIFDRFASPSPDQTAVLAYTDLNGDGLQDAVVTGALHSAVPGDNVLGSFVFVATASTVDDGFSPSYAALDTVWSDALPGDVNRDGIADLTVYSADQQGFDVLVGNGISFNSKHYDSGGFVRDVLLADFDGDLTPDVGVTSSALAGGGSELFVSFGRPLAFPADPTDLGDFGLIEATGAAYTRGTPVDLVTDVAIVSFQQSGGPTDSSRLIYVLNGSTDRRPRAPRGLTPTSLAPADVGGRRVLANSVFTGRFDPSRPRIAEGEPDAPDVLEIFASGSEVRSGSIAQVSLVPGGEQFLTAPPRESTESCDQPARIHCAYGVSGRVVGSDNDALIFAGPASPCDAKDSPPPTTVPYLTLLRWDSTLGRPVCSNTEIPGVPEGRVKRVESGEFGSGQGSDLLIGLATPSGPRVVVIWGFGISSAITGRVIHVARLAERPSFSDTSPLLDARGADIDLDGRPDVILRTRQNILWAKGTPEGFGLIEPLIQDPTGAELPGIVGVPSPDVLPQGGGLAVADLDGNGLPDILIHNGAGFVSFLRTALGSAGAEVAR